MTKYELLQRLEVTAAHIRTTVPPVMQVAHINDLLPDDELVITDAENAQEAVDEFMAGTLNHLAATMGCHYTVRARHIRNRR